MNKFIFIDTMCDGAGALLFIHSKPNFNFLLLFSFLLLIMQSRSRNSTVDYQLIKLLIKSLYEFIDYK